MSAKNKIKFICRNCGAESVKWMGRCTYCGKWNTLEEYTETEIPKHLRAVAGDMKPPRKLSDIKGEEQDRFLLDMPEVDRPLGGGIVPGSVVLWGGEPGIGKSTLILQICHAIAAKGRTVLYAGGEESDVQIKMRARRLGVNEEHCLILQGGSLDAIAEESKRLRPSVLIIDSVQTMYRSDNDAPPGSPTQVRDCTASLVALAKTYGMAVMIVGHVTKEGNLAGPRMLEHMVDVVFYLEGDRNYQFRILRTVKNRFGSTAESGLFVMDEKGLQGISDPSAYLLRGRSRRSPGSLVAACLEGMRPILAEMQTLTLRSQLTMPRRISVGYDYNRMIMLLAVLEKRGKIPFSFDDVYLSVAGGYKVKETAADLAAALSLVSVKTDYLPAQDFMAMGEIGLTGEILPVSKADIRLKEAIKMHFRRFLLPKGNQKEAEAYFKKSGREDIGKETVYVETLADALRLFTK